MRRALTFLSLCLVVASALIAHVATAAADHNVAIGYVRGQGLGNFGVSAAYTIGPLELGSALFARVGDGERGVAIAPMLRLNVAHLRRTSTTFASTAYVEVAPQVVLTSFGGVTASGTGLSATVGYELRFANRLALFVGLGLHSRGVVAGRDGELNVTQASEFGPHIDAGLRYRL